MSHRVTEYACTVYVSETVRHLYMWYCHGFWTSSTTATWPRACQSCWAYGYIAEGSRVVTSDMIRLWWPACITGGS